MRRLPFSVYPFHEGDEVWRDNEFSYYLVAENGTFVVKRNELFSVLLPADRVHPLVKRETKRLYQEDEGLGWLQEQYFLHPPTKVPLALLLDIITFFRGVWERHHAEAEVQLFWNQTTKQFFYGVPEIWTVAGGYFCWFTFLPAPPGTFRVGTIHSHGDIGACQSHIDYDTEQDTDGLHMTIGNITDVFPTIETRVVVDRITWKISPEEIIELPLPPDDALGTVHMLRHGERYPTGSAAAEAFAAYAEPITAARRIMEEQMPTTTYFLVGLGGIGSHLAPILCRWLHHHEPETLVVLIDGKSYEPRKHDRQQFPALGNKAVVQAQALTEACPRLIIQSIDRFIDEYNVAAIIPDNAVIFLMPDNHHTRKIVSDHAQTLSNVVIIAGGNDATDDPSGGLEGNVLVYVRKDGSDITAPLTAYHPEIAEPPDRVPDARSCEEMSTSVPQMLFTNVAVATYMLTTFLAWRQSALTYGELCFRIGDNPALATFAREPLKEE